MTTVDLSLITVTGMQIVVAVYGYIETKHKSQAVIVALGALLIGLTVARIAT